MLVVSFYDLHQSYLPPPSNEAAHLAAQTQPFIKVYDAPSATIEPNFLQATIPLSHGLKILAWREALRGFPDQQLCDFLNYRFPMSYEASSFPTSPNCNHRSATLYQLDNQPAICVLASGQGRDTFMLSCAREIWLYSAKRDFTLIPTHSPGAQMSTADALSRAHLRPDYLMCTASHRESPCHMTWFLRMSLFNDITALVDRRRRPPTITQSSATAQTPGVKAWNLAHPAQPNHASLKFLSALRSTAHQSHVYASLTVPQRGTPHKSPHYSRNSQQQSSIITCFPAQPRLCGHHNEHGAACSGLFIAFPTSWRCHRRL